MRLHRNLVFAVIDGLSEIFNEGAYADKVVQKLLKRDKRWGSRDRSFVAETVYDIVRWKRLYSEIADVSEPFSRENLWRIFAVWATLRGITLPDWKQIIPTPTRRIKGRFDELSNTRKFRESIPDWMDELGEKELGAKWDKEIAALNQQAPVVLRANSLKISRDKLRGILEDENIDTEFIKGYPSALQLTERANVFSTEAFKKGFFEVQDGSSQLVADFLEVKPGQRVVDTCAGAGGKTLHLAALMENIKKLHGKADRVLIDAPCSGLGVLSRNPDAKWKLQPEFLDKIRQTQSEILESYSKMVKPGGKLVYATCSILPSENQEQVKAFLTKEIGKEFIFVKDKKVLSSESGFDGFYMALLERK